MYSIRGSRLLRIAVTLLVFLFLQSSLIAAADKKSPCDKTPEIAIQPRFSKEDQAKAREIRAQGMVKITISEDGDVVSAQVINATSSQAADLLLAFAKSAKFKSRPGCGNTQSAINYTLAGQ
jgi:hypothetical protein